VPADLERFEGWWRSGLGVLAGQKPVLEQFLSLRIVYGIHCGGPGLPAGLLHHALAPQQGTAVVHSACTQNKSLRWGLA